jgi:hypothetical protein
MYALSLLLPRHFCTNSCLVGSVIVVHSLGTIADYSLVCLFVYLWQ